MSSTKEDESLSSDPSNESSVIPDQNDEKSSAVDTSLDTSQLNDDNESKKEDQPIEEEPTIPVHRPTRRSTTEVINNLVENTNEELEEMEKLIRKHSHQRTHASTTKVASPSPHIPQRPRPKKRTSEGSDESPLPKIPQRPTRRSTSPLKSALPTGEEPIGSNKESDSQITPPLVPRQRPLKRNASSPSDSSVSLNIGNSIKTESEPVTRPVVPKERPARIKQSSIKLKGSDAEEEAQTSYDTFISEEVAPEQINTSTSNSTPEESVMPEREENTQNTDIGESNEPESFSNESKEHISTFSEEPLQGVTQVKGASSSQESNNENASADAHFKQEDNLTDDQEVIENSNEPNQVEPQKDSIVNHSEFKENHDLLTEAAGSLEEQSFVADKDSKENSNDKDEDIEEYNETIEKTDLDSTLPEKLTETAKKDKLKEALSNNELSEPISDTAEVSLPAKESQSPEKQPTPVTDANDSETQKPKQEPYIPASRPKKKGPPPVPKKPSSRIAAFQEMLQKQQMKDMENTGTNPSLGDKDKQPPRKMNFINDLNNVIALPGMVPPAGLKTTNTSQTFDNNTTEVKKELTDIRQKRARGPRGRKLPSKVNNVTKIIAKNENYTVEVKPLWSLRIVPKQVVIENGAFQKKEEDDDEQEYEVIERDDTDRYNENENSTQEEENTASREESPDISDISQTPVQKVTDSLSDSITSRDEDGSVWMVEEDFETETEKKMQDQFIEEDKKYTESLSKQTSVQLTPGSENNEQIVEDESSTDADSNITGESNNM